ncbi:hypothetical protein Ddye_027796 [Dipteronia dyeriana]|uniref:Uncharacterized protein n=1 Tax=Dipteronia dyeriana TaxID=168575 RepID=A0AAD9TQ09_9ROSI|nr:hypothetical protein Ddye_027796 [Dipteronia dyeriana]
MAEIVVNLVIDKLGPLLVQEIKFLRGVRQEIEDVREELKSIRFFLKDAEKRSAIEELEGNNNSDVQQWVAQVREVAYCIEDVLDEFAFTVAQLSHGRGIVGFLRKANRSLKKLKLRQNVVNDIQEIKASLAKIQDRRKRYRLDSIKKESDVETRNVTRQGGCGVGSYYTEEDQIVGYESIRKELIDLMVNKIPQRRVIVLVGTGGLGKTTLAASVYKKNDVKNHFNCRAWIHVGKTYIKEDLLRRTIQKLYSSLDENAPGHMETMDEMGLIDMLRKYLENKSYMVVFDDVWKDEFWRYVEHALPDNHKSSRLIITTRNRVVADFLPTDVEHTDVILKGLPWDKAWQLFCMKAFNSDGFCPPELEELSNKILEKCGGLPLAIVAVGGLLSKKNQIVTEWEKLFNNLGEDLGSDPHLRSCNRVLSEGFYDLPHHLKPCLLYFGLFPESYSIGCGRLIRLWIAEGFVQFQSNNSNGPEEIGQEYLTELIERNLVQVLETKVQGKPLNCRVHDLMHEIILKKTEQSGFSRILNEHNMSQCTTTRRLTISESTNNVLVRINDSKVRSLFLSNMVELPRSFMSTISTDKFKLMRVLDFEDSPIDYVPEGVGNLYHLHYLSLKNTKVKVLPKTVGKLLNLETLNLKNTLVGELPVEIKNLKKLRYLIITHLHRPYMSYGEGTNIQEGFGSLIDLRKLQGVRLNSKTFEELRKLRQLRGLGVQLVNGNGKDLFSSIANMNYLKLLAIELPNRDETFDIESMASLPKYLERLYLTGNLKKLPDWILNLQNLAKVYLTRSDFTDDPMIVLHSLPNLLKLYLVEAYNGEQLHIEQGWFPKLVELYLFDLKGLKFIMIEGGAMSLLETLVISACPLLKVIPSGVENLRNLSVLDFYDMLMEIESNSTFVTSETLEKLKHIPKVIASSHDKEGKIIVKYVNDIFSLPCQSVEALPEKKGETSFS